MTSGWPRAAATALQFLTRLPIPGGASADPARFEADIGRALALFPLMGALIGALTALALWLASQLWPLPLAVLLALAMEARLTGALHEDAVADLCDGFGGGRMAEDVLRIMKDSRIGVFGLLGLAFALALLLGLPVPLLGLWWDARAMLLALLAAALFLAWFRRLVLRRLSGSTGDCFGFAGYAGLILATLAFAAGR